MINQIRNLKNYLLPVSGVAKNRFLRSLKYYVYAYCEIDDDNKRLPIYVGKGNLDRFFSHLDNLNDLSSKKNRKIVNLIKEKRLSIDILAYKIDEKTALSIESACIDLMGIENLENIVRGRGNNIKRIPLNELTNMLTDKTVKVEKKHAGISILINKHYKPTFGDLEIFEITRGIWSKKMKTTCEKNNIKYAYATFKDVVKDIYEIHSWVPAGTQEYFTRILDPERLKTSRWEFVGKKAPAELRNKYIGKVIERKRSFGDPFVKVGFE
tara:strand:+ start:624 stop:1427 length:804 start_codon:yes stop_codon:yes gene_type:complete